MTFNDELERQAFEKWYLSYWKEKAPWAANKTIKDVIDIRGNGNYENYGFASGCWAGWKARARQERNDE